MQGIFYTVIPESSIETSATTRQQALDRFLAGVERRALVMAEIATSSREEALDLVQESMLAFVRAYANKPEEQWPPLFHRVLQNRIRDWYRRSKVRNRWKAWLGFGDSDDDTDPIQSLPDPRRSTPESELKQADTGKAIVAAVGRLPLRQQQAFMLRTWEGLDVATTARVMGCSQGSVKTHLSRAMQTLRLSLEEYRE